MIEIFSVFGSEFCHQKASFELIQKLFHIGKFIETEKAVSAQKAKADTACLVFNSTCSDLIKNLTNKLFSCPETVVY